MTGWGEVAFDPYLPADMVLDHADIAVVVTDRLCNILYVNDFAARLFRVSGDVSRLAGCPVVSLGLFADDGVRKTEDLAGHVLRGRSWEGTFESERGDGSRTLIRGIAVPLRPDCQACKARLYSFVGSSADDIDAQHSTPRPAPGLDAPGAGPMVPATIHKP